jgi:ABC-type xylose transport system permease subunit
MKPKRFRKVVRWKNADSLGVTILFSLVLIWSILGLTFFDSATGVAILLMILIALIASIPFIDKTTKWKREVYYEEIK